MSETPLKVLIADDHPLILAGIRRALDRADDVEVVGEARSSVEVMHLIERRRPQLVLMDLRMPDVLGTEHIEQVRSTWPDVKVVVLSGSEDKGSIDSALNAGASAFVVKSVGSADLASILRQVAGGSVFHAVGQSVAGGAGDPGASANGFEGPPLTARERSILAAAAQGKTTTQISRELFVSEHTVKFHLTNIYRKLGVPNRAAAVRWALEHGLA
jgi:DNA-binding NarL/FixJ family response regulator